jgi:hypothetical protein
MMEKEREFYIKEWGYSVKLMERLAKKKEYVKRFRLEYSIFLSGFKTRGKRVRYFFEYILRYGSMLLHFVRYQFTQTKKINPESVYIFHVTNSVSILKTVVPVIELLIKEGITPVLLCPANQYHKLSAVMDKRLYELVTVFEQVNTGRNFLSRISALAWAVLRSFGAMIWFSCQTGEGSFFSSTNFARYSLAHFYFDDFWQNYFRQGKKVLLAADDFWFWESLLFTTAYSSNTRTICLAHGRVSDLSYPMLAKQLYAWGEIDYREMLDKFGARPEEVVIAGSLYFDKVYNDIRATLDQTSAFEKPSISFFTQPYIKVIASTEPYYREVISWFYELSEVAYSGKEFVIKPHPFEDVAYYQDRPEKIVLSKEPILTALGHTCIMLTVDSTSYLEACMFGVPLIQLLPKGEPIFIDVSATGLTHKIQSANELRELVKNLLSDKEFYKHSVDRSSTALSKFFYCLGESEGKLKELLIFA